MPDTKPGKPPRKFQRARFLFILFVVIFALSFGVTLRFSSQPSAALARFVESELSKIFAPRVTIREARLDPSQRSIILSDVRVGDGDQPDLKIQKAIIQLEFHLQESEKVRVSQLYLIEPELHAGAIARLFRSGGNAPPERLPHVMLTQGKVDLYAPGVGSMEFYDLSASVVPRENGELAVEGTARTPLRGAVRMGGSINIQTGALDLRAETEVAIDLAAITNEKIDPEIEYWRRECQPAGELKFFAGLSRASTTAPVVTSAEIEASGIRFTAPNIKIGDRTILLKDVAATGFNIQGRLDEDGSVRISGQGKVLGGDFSVLCEARVDAESRKLQKIQAGARIRNLLLGPNIQKIIDGVDDGVADAIRGLRPEGNVDLAAFAAWDDATNTPDIHASLDLSSETKLTFLGFLNQDNSVDASFPYPISGLSGRASFRPGKVIISGVRGAMGTGRMEGSGTITGGGLVGIDIHVKGAGLAIDDLLRDSLKGIPREDPRLMDLLKNDPQWADPVAHTWTAKGLPDGPETLQLFDLQGKLNFNIDVTRPEGRRAADVVVRAASDGNISGAFRDLPVRVDGLLGSVIFNKGLVRFGFDGTARGAKVRIEGLVDGRDDANGRSPSRNGLSLRVTGRDFPLDPSLADAFDAAAPEAGAFIRDIEPSAKCDFEYRGERPVNFINNTVETFLTIQSRDGVVRRAPAVGIQLENLVASLTVMTRASQSGAPSLRVWLDSVRTKYFGRPVISSGIFTNREGAEPELELSVSGTGLPLQNALLEQLLEKEAPRAREAISKFQFSGSFDASVKRHSGPNFSNMSIEGNVFDATIIGPGVPGNVTHASGPVEINNSGILTSPRLVGTLNLTEVVMEDFKIRPGGDREPVVVSGRVTSETPLDVFDLVRKAMPDSTAWVDNMALAMKATPKGMEWELSIPAEGLPVFKAGGMLQITDGTAVSKQLDDRIEGAGEIESLLFDGKEFSAKAKARGLSMFVLGAPMTNITGDIEINSREMKLTNFEADFVGGKLRPPKNGGNEILTIDFTKEVPWWALKFHLADADLATVFSYVPMATSGITGRMRLGLEVEGPGADLRKYKGSGVLLVNDATLFEVPGFKPVPDALKLQERKAFKEMTADFQILNALVNFSKLVLTSDDLVLRGDGWLGFDGQIQMTLLPRFFLNRIPVLKQFINLFQDLIVDVTVDGTISKPRHHVNLFGARATRRGATVVAPAPPIRLGDRF